MHLVVFILGFLPLFASGAVADVIKIEGGGAAISAIFLPIQHAYREETGIELVVSTTTPVQALIALERGAVDLATATIPLEEMIAGAREAGVNIDPATLHSAKIGRSSIVVFANAANRLRKLSNKQLQGLFSGAITNWREVGGDDLPVVVVWGKKTQGMNSLFKRVILKGADVTPAAIQAIDFDDIRKKIMAHPGAIGINVDGFSIGGIHLIQTQAIPCDIIAVTKGALSKRISKLLKWISNIFSAF